MIKANELRIGNKVTDEWYESFKTIITVESINDKGINLAIEDDGNYPECAQTWIEPEDRLDNLFGIPLTEEILLRCGFEKVDQGYDKKGIFISEYLGYPIYNPFGDYIDSAPCAHLHELQNLYFALTGEELTYNNIV